MSLVEQLLNVGSGVVLALIVGQIVYPLFGYAVSVKDNLGLTIIFTLVSIVRGYVWRRVFNRLHQRKVGWA
ncbi:MAG: hypothetical protein H7Z12_15240 [Rhodospirillaceae bacterium]|nr:hypothetical protein [Rhodospirillales bacterium]